MKEWELTILARRRHGMGLMQLLLLRLLEKYVDGHPSASTRHTANIDLLHSALQWCYVLIIETSGTIATVCMTSSRRT